MGRSALLPLALLSACASALPEPPRPARSEAGRLVQDLEYAYSALESIHPSLHEHASRADLRGEIDAARAKGPALDRRAAYFSLMRLVGRVRDAHTRMASWAEIEDPRLPVLFEDAADGVWVGAVQESAKGCFAKRLRAIEGVPVEEALSRVSPLVPFENELQRRLNAAALLASPRALVECGVSKRIDGARLLLEDREGKQDEVELAALSPAPVVGWLFYATPGSDRLLRKTHPGEAWWWRRIDGKPVLYLQYDQCLYRTEHPFEETAREVLEAIDAGGVETLVVDLRENAGGNSSVLRPLIDGLLERRPKLPGERIRVLIGRRTFSSGMMNALQLQRQLGAVLVGEPTLQKPDGFGEIRTFELPNTRWRIDVSTKRFDQVGDDRPSLEPDVLVPSGFEDLLEGRDPVLESALALP